MIAGHPGPPLRSTTGSGRGVGDSERKTAAWIRMVPDAGSRRLAGTARVPQSTTLVGEVKGQSPHSIIGAAGAAVVAELDVVGGATVVVVVVVVAIPESVPEHAAETSSRDTRVAVRRTSRSSPIHPAVTTGEGRVWRRGHHYRGPLMSSPLVEARGLVKRFGEFTAVDGIDFDVRPGEAFGFLGPNGAGKSSTMRIIGAVSPPTEGTISVLGMDPVADGPKIRARLGVVPQEDNLDQELSVYENLFIYGRYFGLPRKVIDERIDELLGFAQLEERRQSRVEPLSGGMKRRLTIARGLVNEPELLLLDEPTTGLDPQARHLLWDRLYRLKQEGVTLIITTHYMDEAEQLCDRLVIMDRGRIVADGSTESRERPRTRGPGAPAGSASSKDRRRR